MILVTGATGRTGGEVVSQLATHELEVRAMIHDPSKAAALTAPSMGADYSNRESLDRALDGVTSAYLVSSPSEHAAEWQIRFIDAAKQAGVHHIVKLSIIGASLDAECRFQRSHAEIEKALKESGIAWTILRPNFFMQTVPQYMQGSSFFSLSGQGKVSLVDLRDVAGVAVAALVEEGHRGNEYVLTGPEAFSPQDIADKIASTKDRRVDIVQATEEEARFVMKQSGFPAWNTEGVLELNRYFRIGRAEATTDLIHKLLDRKPRSLEQFLTHDLP